MKITKHGVSIGMKRTGNDLFLFLKAQGKLTHEDYEIITPIIDSALSEVKTPRVRVLIDATELEGWDARAAWDDFKIGLKHGNEFERVAVYGNKKWQEYAAKIGGWFTAGDVKYFDSESDALSWLDE